MVDMSMSDTLISFETAKLAKKKGFDFSKIEIRDSNTLKVVSNVNERRKYFETDKDANLIQLPTQSLLQKWLREEHNIFIKIDINCYNYFWFDLYDLKNTTSQRINYIGSVTDEKSGLYIQYKQALEDGLQDALKLIK